MQLIEPEVIDAQLICQLINVQGLVSHPVAACYEDGTINIKPHQAYEIFPSVWKVGSPIFL